MTVTSEPTRSTKTRAVVEAPDHAQAWSVCQEGRDRILAGRVKEGLALLQRAAVLAPDHPYIQINSLTHLHYKLGHTRQELFEGFCDWAQRFVPPSLAQAIPVHNPDPNRPLRIGYISPDFCRHSVATTFEPVLDGFDRGTFSAYGYGNVAQPDEITKRLADKFDVYRSIHGKDLTTILEQIRADRIDILVHLGGHTAHNCLEILAFKPAPIQMDWGGLSTTGMPQVDVRITDACYDPPVCRSTYVEQCIDLPGGLTVFRPPAQSPLVGALPALKTGIVTFGVFNSCAKINPFVLELWAGILRALPTARLLMKFAHGDEPEVQTWYHSFFEHQGVGAQRIDILGWQPEGRHLDLFNRVDLMLDTYPYNGGLTTLEGLWMGVPSVTLTGDTFVSRAGLSILKPVHLEVFCATEARQYVEKAIAFATQLPELAEIRRGLRASLLASPLCDVGRVTWELAEAYRSIWTERCRRCAGRVNNRKPRKRRERRF